MSTLGWPEQTPELEDVLSDECADHESRDHHAVGRADGACRVSTTRARCHSRRVYITPKILDGYGETMSKSKGNGVDPLDVIEKFGADALRFGIAHLTTETQDVRLPVEFECPHCKARVSADEEEPTVAAGGVREVWPAFQHAVGGEAGGQGAAARGGR